MCLPSKHCATLLTNVSTFVVNLGNFYFHWLYIAKKLYWKLSAKIKSFLRFSIVRIQPKFKKICQIFTHVQVCGQKYKKMFLKLYFHILACSQIWLNLHVDHQHFGYITKLTKRNTDLRNEDAKLDRYKHTNLETLNFDSSLVVKGFLSFQSQYINIIYNLFKRHEVLKNSMDKLQNLISKNKKYWIFSVCHF